MTIIFSKILAPTDIKCNLLIPTTCFVNLTVYDHKCEREWMFCCTVRRSEITDDGVLSVGWLEFVQRKNLKPNDKVIFPEEIDHTDKATLIIEVMRKIRLFGQDIWAQVP